MKRKHEEHENHERWLVSYADFITLLFAFFVVMYATSTANEEKQKEFEKSIQVNLHLVGQGGNKVNHSMADALAELSSPVSSEFPTNTGNREVQRYVEDQVDKKLGKESQNYIRDIYHDTLGVKITLAATSVFEGGSAKLQRSALKSLDALAQILKETNKKLVIEGHTDNTPVRGGQYGSNWELAAARSNAVIRYLTKVHGLGEDRFIAMAYGENKPLAPNDTEERRALNRRIEIQIITNEKGL